MALVPRVCEDGSNGDKIFQERVFFPLFASKLLPY